VGALFNLDLRTHFTDWECEVVVVVAGSVGYDLREVGVQCPGHTRQCS
jgi:hypothetical protein